MKKFFFYLGIIVLFACRSGTYSELLKEEESLISDFIKRQKIKVVKKYPTDWSDPTVFWAVESYDNLYFHLSDAGETNGDTVRLGDIIVLRYRKYTLEAYADTSSCWTTMEVPYPIEFHYGTDMINACAAWHVAVKYMRYSGAECKIICPSKLGFTADNNSVTPYGYDMRILIKKY